MPAEWEPHKATWVAWPTKLSDWPGRFAPVPWVYAEIIRILSRYEPVHVLVQDDKQETQAKTMLVKAEADLKKVRFYQQPSNRSWLRDSGPIFVQDGDGQKVALDWGFNAWAKYDDWQIDDAVAAAVAKKAKARRVQPVYQGKRVTLEGGGIDVNGAGLLLTTEEWLLSDTQIRNPGYSREDYERVFHEYLGIDQVLWLGDGIVGDDTHGHVDDLARFVDPQTIVNVLETNPADENYHRTHANKERLLGMRDTRGRQLNIVDLPMPNPLSFRKQRLPASYANFYIGNGVVLVPTFNDPRDRTAVGILADLFPNHEVIGLHCVELVWGLGTLHCLTQQEPAE